jgi:ferredoxin like protein
MVNLIRDFVKPLLASKISNPEATGEAATTGTETLRPKVLIQEMVDTVRFNIHKDPHITVETEKCRDCDTTACVYVCPANLFNIVNGEMLFVYDNCFECGTCYVACDRKAITWDYPQGGYGVSFRQA